MAIPFGESKYELGIIGDFQARNISSATRVEFLGNWVQAKKILDGLPHEVRRTVYLAMKAYAKLYHQRVKQTIRSGGLGMGWRPYSEKYEKYKRAHSRRGFPAFYQLRGLLLQAIILEDDGKYRVRVNVSSDRKFMTRKGDLTASQVMNILEHGSVTRNIAARPLFGPVWKSMGGNKALREFVAQRVGKKLNAYSLTY